MVVLDDTGLARLCEHIKTMVGSVDGESAYEIAKRLGYEGTEEEWIASLKGDTGNTGSTGAAGVGIQSVVQTTTSSADGGSNVITVTKTDNTTSTFTVKNGTKGSTGAAGTSCTHSWSGTNLTVTSASGTSTANLGLQYSYGNSDLTEGVSSLAHGMLYFVYD